MQRDREVSIFWGITSSKAVAGRAARASGNFATRSVRKLSGPTFIDLDGWVRMRLRSILRHRRGGRGRGRGIDHHRWPNAFFAEHGLFSLAVAHVQVRQSSS